MKAIKNFLNKYKDMPIQSKASLWFVVCSMLQQGISIITTPIFTKKLFTTEEYGMYTVFDSWQRIIIIFASLNLASGVYLRGLIKYEDDEEEFTASLQSLFVTVFTIVFLIYFVFAGFWNTLLEMPKEYMICMFIDMLMCVSFHFWSSKQRAFFKYKALVAVTLINVILKPTISIIAILFSTDHVFARVSMIALADTLVFGYFFLSMFIKKGKKISFKYWKYALSYNIPLVPHYLSQIVLNQSDRIMIKSICSKSDAGIYGLVYTVASFMLIANQSILNAYNPWMYQRIKKKDYKAIAPYSMKLLVLVAAANLMLIILAPEAIAIIGNGKYMPGIWVVPPVAMSVYFMFMYNLFANVEFYFEKTKIMMVASACGAILNVILNAVFIPKYGYYAAGYTTLFCYLCYCLFHYTVMKMILKKELGGKAIYDMRLIILISAIFMALGFGCTVLYEHIIIKYVVIVIVAVIAFIKRKQIMELMRPKKS